MYANELVARGGDVEVRLLLVDEERVRHPNVLDELRADAEYLDAALLLECQPWIRPELPKVKIQREVLGGFTWLAADYGDLQKRRLRVNLAILYIIRAVRWGERLRFEI
jgi:hypothetical protein